ncbi:MAG TPA: ATP-binding protein, partial [Anaeromyxobacter sp.]
ASYVCAPMLARRRTLGAITLIRADGDRALGDEDVALVCELARRAAVAVDERRRRRETRELLRLFARLASGRLELERLPVELAEVVESAGRAVSEEAQAKNAAVEMTVEAADVRVCGDRRRLRQVTQRVLEGAVRAAVAGGRVVVGLRHDGASALLDVSATGAATSPLAGLRLAIVRRLLELHGGSAATARIADRGPTLTLRIPLIASSVDLKRHPAVSIRPLWQRARPRVIVTTWICTRADSSRCS